MDCQAGVKWINPCRSPVVGIGAPHSTAEAEAPGSPDVPTDQSQVQSDRPGLLEAPILNDQKPEGFGSEKSRRSPHGHSVSIVMDPA